MQRKVFRVEQMFADRRVAAPLEKAAARASTNQIKAVPASSRESDALGRELALLRETIASNRRDLAALISEGKERRMARAAGELGAAIAGMEQATQKILQTAESIDDSARTLNAALKGDYERGLARDIQDRTVEIYEACNFQDLAGQRIGKVIGMLATVEEQLAALLARCGGQNADAPKAGAHNGLINGPKLDGDVGHADQHAIDAMFG